MPARAGSCPVEIDLGLDDAEVVRALSRDWRLTYTWISRSPEFESPFSDGRHIYGSIAVSREYLREKPGQQRLPRVLHWLGDVSAELALGKGITRLHPQRPGERTLNGPAGRFGLTKGVGDHWTIGGEITGVTRQGGQPEPTVDTFLVTSACTLGFRPLGSKGPGILHLRAGLGRATATVERTANDEAVRQFRESGLGILAGVNYVRTLGVILSLGVDSTWSSGSIRKTHFEKTSFLTTTLIVKATPPKLAFKSKPVPAPPPPPPPSSSGGRNS